MTGRRGTPAPSMEYPFMVTRGEAATLLGALEAWRQIDGAPALVAPLRARLAELLADLEVTA